MVRFWRFPFCVLEQNKDLHFPADVYFEDQINIVVGLTHPYPPPLLCQESLLIKTVLTHGYTVDEQGRKLSKSKGNYIGLDKLISQYGADILRLWVSSTDYRNEVSISDEIMKRTADAYRRIRNTIRFLLANLFDFNPEQNKLPTTDWVLLDKWVVKRAQSIQKEICDAYESYQFHLIYQKIHNFCAVDLGSFYLDIIKDRQYTTPVDSKARRSCQNAMYHILQALTRWIAPILSFTAEEVWQSIPQTQDESIFLQNWYQAWPVIDDVDLEEWSMIQSIRNEVNKAIEKSRQAGLIGSALEAEVTLYADDNTYSLLHHFENELRFIFITSKASLYALQDKPNQLELSETGVAIEVHATVATKCARCWHRLPEVGDSQDHPTLCPRCIGNITGQDETRKYA